MELWNTLETLSQRAATVVGHVATEEATKTALVLPFLQALGYDIFDPNEVIPEFVADVGIKKGEKVDYAICQNGDPAILIECKPHGSKLDGYSSQLYRYFSVTPARIAILTDGIEYRLYSDLVEPNKLDQKPFLSVSLLALKRDTVQQLQCLCKGDFDLEQALRSAEDLRYIGAIREHFAKELAEPSDTFVRIMVDSCYSGRFTQSVTDKFRSLVRTATKSYISDAVDQRLRAAIERNRAAEESEPGEATEAHDDQDSEIVTTAEELEGYFIVKAILRDLVEPRRVVARDVRSYFGILLDDNNRKPICRLWFNGLSKYLGVFDAEKSETRLAVSGPDDLFQHADALRQSLQHSLAR